VPQLFLLQPPATQLRGLSSCIWLSYGCNCLSRLGVLPCRNWKRKNVFVSVERP
jgi:hypothetical protein